jgi:ABC-type enterochelin transport system substrate-binding protein
MRKSKKRLELGEEKWAEYQRQRVNKKSEDWNRRNVEKVIKSRRRKKQLLVEYKGGACEKCGLKSTIMAIYDFHHLDPSQKEFGLAAAGKNLSIDQCKKEVDKCILVCKNCHAIIHHELEEQKIKDLLGS